LKGELDPSLHVYQRFSVPERSATNDSPIAISPDTTRLASDLKNVLDRNLLSMQLPCAHPGMIIPSLQFMIPTLQGQLGCHMDAKGRVDWNAYFYSTGINGPRDSREPALQYLDMRARLGKGQGLAEVAECLQSCCALVLFKKWESLLHRDGSFRESEMALECSRHSNVMVTEEEYNTTMKAILSRVSYGDDPTGYTEDEVMLWGVDSRLQHLFVIAMMQEAFFKEFEQRRDEFVARFSSPDFEADALIFLENVQQLVKHIVSGSNPYFNERVNIFFVKQRGYARMVLPSDEEATDLYHRFSSFSRTFTFGRPQDAISRSSMRQELQNLFTCFPCTCNTGIAARAAGLRMTAILRDGLSEEGCRYEDTCPDCSDKCETYDAMNNSAVCSRRCHRGPMWRASLDAEKNARECTTVQYECFAGNSRLVPLLAFSAQAADKDERFMAWKAAINTCHTACEMVLDPFYDDDGFGRTCGAKDFRQKAMLKDVRMGAEWPLHYRRWVRTVVRREFRKGSKVDGMEEDEEKKDDTVLYWICMELAPSDIPFANIYDDMHHDVA
jgi:hypothetical protein